MTSKITQTSVQPNPQMPGFEPATSSAAQTLTSGTGLPVHGAGVGNGSLSSLSLSTSSSPRISLDQVSSDDSTKPMPGLPSIIVTGPDGAGATQHADRAVVDPSTGRFNRPNILGALKAMHDAMPSLKSIPPAHAKGREAFEQVLEGIETLVAHVKKMPAGGPAASRDLGLELRDSFAKLQDLAYKATDAMVPTHALSMIMDKPLPDINHNWIGFGNALGGMFGELKRNSLTAAAPFAADAYAIKEHANLEHVVDIDQPGAITINREGISAGGTAGVLGISGSVSKGQLQLRDDDGAFLLIGNHDINGSISADLLLALLSGQGGTGFGRRVLADGDTRVAIKARSNMDAENTSEKLIANTAGPMARDLREGIETAKNGIGMLLGRNYLQATGVPSYLGDDKVAKGYNTTKLGLYAKQADSFAKALDGKDGTGPGALSQMVASSYPSIAAIAKQAVAGNADMPDASPLDKTSPAPAALGRTALHYRQPYGDAVAALGIKGPTGLDGNAEVSLGASFMVKGDKLDVRVKATKVAHEMLDMSTFKDPKQAFNLVHQYDAQLGANPAADPPHMRKYRVVHDALGGPALDGAVAAHAGVFGIAPPPQFDEAITQPSRAKLGTAQALFKELGQIAGDLAVHGEALMAQPDKQSGSIDGELEAMRSSAFKAINAAVWGASYTSNGIMAGSGYLTGAKHEKPGDAEAAAMKDPQDFLAKSHDVLSKALGLASAHLTVQKMQLTTQQTAAGGLTAGSRLAMRNADTEYATARTVMDRTFLPVKKGNLAKESSIASEATFQRHHLTGAANVAGPGSLNVPAMISSIFKTGPVTDNASMNVKGSVQAQFQTAHTQILPSRMGQNLELTVTLESGVPLTGDVLNKAINKAVKKLGKGVVPKDFKMKTEDLLPLANQFLNPLRASGKGATLVVGLRHAQDTALVAGTNLMYMRMFESGTGGGSVTVAPSVAASVTGAPVSVTPSAFELTRKPSFEVMGSDLGYLSMQHGNLMGALEKSKAALATAGTPSEELPDQAAHALANDPELANRYFGKSDMITTVVERHMTAVAAIHAKKVPGPAETLPNEFFTYYTREPFASVRLSGNEVAHHAPGSTAGGSDPAAVPPAMNQVANLNIAPADWNALKAKVDQLPDVASRVKFFTQNPDGRNALDTFIKVVDNVTQTWASTIHHADENRKFGFASSVKPQD